MTTTAIVAIAVATMFLGVAIDRGSNPSFKKEQHKEFNDPSKADN